MVEATSQHEQPQGTGSGPGIAWRSAYKEATLRESAR